MHDLWAAQVFLWFLIMFMSSELLIQASSFVGLLMMLKFVGWLMTKLILNVIVDYVHVL